MNKIMLQILVLFTLALNATDNLWAAKPVVYVPLGSANEVAVVDAIRNKEIGTIQGVINSHGLAATPDGKFLLAGSLTQQAAGAIPSKPAEMTEEEHRAHHSAPEGGATQTSNTGILYLIDTKSRQIIHQIAVPGPIHHVAITPDGRYAISTHPGLGGVSIVDINERKLVHMIATGPIPNYVVVSTDGKAIYVSNAGNNTVSEITPSHWIVNRNMLAGKTPEHMVLSPDEIMLYVANVAAGEVSMLDLKQGKVVATFSIGPETHGVALSDDGAVLFASAKDGNKLVAVNLQYKVEKILNLEPAPYHIAVIPGTGKLYVSSREKPMLWVVDLNSFAVESEIDIQGEGHQIVVVANGG